MRHTRSLKKKKREDKMLAKILGWFWILTGIIFLLKPEWLRKRLQKKSYKILKKYLFVIALFFGFLFITAAFKSAGISSKLLLFFGIIAIFKSLFFLKAKAAARILDWFIRQPSFLFRIVALCQIILGIIILSV